ncbi:MAG: helix-turn-helix transcriptional regulator [Desulfovibrio fairfieldensis]
MDVTEDKGRKLNWEQTCKLLGCSRSHFYNLVNSGRLPAVRTGEVKGVRVYEADCQAYLRNHAISWSKE